jgi:hypothetical protein
MKQLLIVIFLLLPFGAKAAGPGAAASFNSAISDSAGGAHTGIIVPADPELRMDVTGEIIEAFTRLEIQMQARGKGKIGFSARQNGPYVRIEYKYRVDRFYSKLDFYYDPERAVCFRQADLIRCFAQIGFRRKSNSPERVEEQPFLFAQNEIVLREQPDGSLKPLRICAYEECKDIE